MKLDSVKRSLEGMTCRTHGKHPKVIITGSSLKIDCCCEAFRSEVQRKFDSYVKKQTDEEVGDILKKLSK